MAISGVGGNYSNVYEGTYATQKNAAAKKAETKEAASAQAGKAQNSGEKSVSDYYSYLQKNYDCMSSGNVTISSEYLKKCSGDSQKAKELEDFLKKIPELEKQGYEQLSAQNKALGVTETGMTNAERMKKNMDERLEKQKEKKEEEEKVKEKKEEKAEQAEKMEAKTMMQKEEPEDAYYPKFDMNV